MNNESSVTARGACLCPCRRHSHVCVRQRPRGTCWRCSACLEGLHIGVATQTFLPLFPTKPKAQAQLYQCASPLHAPCFSSRPGVHARMESSPTAPAVLLKRTMLSTASLQRHAQRHSICLDSLLRPSLERSASTPRAVCQCRAALTKRHPISQMAPQVFTQRPLCFNAVTQVL